jgi:hypothetical protein
MPNGTEAPTGTTLVTEDQLTEWIRFHIGWTIWDTDAGARTLHREFTFTRSDTGQQTPPHTLAWALPAASLLGPYPHAHEAAARLSRDYTITRREA